MNELIDAIPTAQVMHQLQAKKTAFYGTIKHLNIKTFLDGKTSMLTMADADRLKEHYSGKGIVDSNGHSTNAIAVRPEFGLQHQSDHQANSQFLSEVASLVQAIASLQPEQPKDILSIQRQLQEACDRGWCLSSNQLAEILGLSLKTIHKYRHLSRYGFNCNAISNGRLKVWRIERAT